MENEIFDSYSSHDFWLRLDNAAKIYPAVRDRELTSVFRISVELKARIKARQFIDAVHALENRFPYYKVKLKAGFFWYYLEYDNLPIEVKADKRAPCRAFGKNEFMFRVLVKDKRIGVEFSHILTDGTGAFVFLKSLVLTYFDKCGFEVPAGPASLLSSKHVFEEEYEDAYQRYFKKDSSPLTKLPKAFHLPFPLRSPPRLRILVGSIPLDKITAIAKTFEVSLTEYLIAVYLYALQDVYLHMPALIRKRSHKTVRIEVPINLRKMYPSRTMRNFTLYVLPQIDLRLGHYTFEETIKTVYHQMHLETDQKLIGKMISSNVSGEKNPFLRGIPLFIKSFFLSKLYTMGTYEYSGVITNLGKVNFTPQLNDLINRFVFIPPPPNKTLKANCGVIGFNNKLVISFGNISRSRALEQCFFKFLTSAGIPVKIEEY